MVLVRRLKGEKNIKTIVRSNLIEFDENGEADVPEELAAVFKEIGEATREYEVIQDEAQAEEEQPKPKKRRTRKKGDTTNEAI